MEEEVPLVIVKVRGCLLHYLGGRGSLSRIIMSAEDREAR